MKFLALGKLGRKESIDDYPGALIPLAQAKRHATVLAGYSPQKSREDSEGSATAALNKGSPNKYHLSEDGIPRTSSTEYNPYTIKGLKAEVYEDLAVSGHDSPYDRPFSKKSIKVLER